MRVWLRVWITLQKRKAEDPRGGGDAVCNDIVCTRLKTEQQGRASTHKHS
jgi:hypothetical protein